MSALPPSSAQPPGLDLRVEGVDLRFGGIHALRDVSFAAERGQITAVIGPNGAGKTSVFNTISGFYTPSAGRVWLERRGHHTACRCTPRAGAGPGAHLPEHRAVPRPDRARQHQARRPRAPCETTCSSALVYVARARAREETGAARARSSERVIDFLEIDHIRHRSVDALPYGLQKRVELARALAMRPRVLLLDEPVAGMNREETEDMARFILDVQEEWGVDRAAGRARHGHGDGHLRPCRAC